MLHQNFDSAASAQAAWRHEGQRAANQGMFYCPVPCLSLQPIEATQAKKITGVGRAAYSRSRSTANVQVKRARVKTASGEHTRMLTVGSSQGNEYNGVSLKRRHSCLRGVLTHVQDPVRTAAGRSLHQLGDGERQFLFEKDTQNDRRGRVPSFKNRAEMLFVALTVSPSLFFPPRE